MDLTKTLSLTDYKLLKPTLAKVIVATTGNLSKTEMAEMLCAKLQYLAAPVEGSFRKLTSNSAIGFIRANRQTRELDTAGKKGDLTARYKVMGSNLLMDKQDRTLWEVRSGPTGPYVARHGHEDLSELVEASVVSRSDVPRISRVTTAKAAKAEFTAFCTPLGVMDYGFVTRSNDSACEVIAASTGNRTVVRNEMIAGVYPVTIDRELHAQIKARVMTSEEKARAADYWRTLFSYAPEYADELIKAVNETAAM